MIYKINDTVYHWNFGKGTVIGIDDKLPTNTLILVMFETSEETFNSCGRWAHFEEPTLSFKPYSLVNGGFTQERPRDDIKSGDMVFVKNTFHNLWAVRIFSHFSDDNKGVYCFTDQKAGGKVSYWDKFSLNKPF